MQLARIAQAAHVVSPRAKADFRHARAIERTTGITTVFGFTGFEPNDLRPKEHRT